MSKLKVPFFMSSTTFWLIIWVLSFLLGIFIRNQYINPTTDQQVITEYKAQVTEWKTRYKTLYKQKRVFIPMPVYKLTDCESTLDTCEASLEAIKLWCDPECKQRLDKCLESLHTAYNLNRGFYSQEF